MSFNQPIWDDAPGPQFDALRADTAVDACVVGLGGSGLTAVQTLQQMGLRVTGIDAGRIAGGAAGRNGGFLLAGGAEFHHDAVQRWGHDRAMEIYHQTLREIDRLTADLPDLVRRVGSFRLAVSAEEVEDCRRQFAQMQQDGLPAEWVEGPGGTGIRVPTDAAFQPLQRCRRLAAQLSALGVPLHEMTPVLGIEPGMVRTAHGTVRAETIIVAVDGRLEVLLPSLQGRVRTARLQMLATEPTDEVTITGAVYARYGFEYWHQRPDGRVALGGLRDRFGESEWTSDAVPSTALQDELERVLREQVGITRAAVTHRWAGAVGFTPDYLPVVDEVHPDVWAIGGYCGTGNVVGAICGRGVAHLARSGDRSFLGGFAPRG